MEFKNIAFADTINVLYKVKQKKNYKTLQEVYAHMEESQIDDALEILCVSYNLANPENQKNFEDFINLLSENNIGVIEATEIYQKLIESLMFGGMTEEEIEERKNVLLNLKEK